MNLNHDAKWVDIPAGENASITHKNERYPTREIYINGNDDADIEGHINRHVNTAVGSFKAQHGDDAKFSVYVTRRGEEPMVNPKGGKTGIYSVAVLEK